MAGFIETLPNASSSQRIIDPGRPGPSWVDGLADIASKGVQLAGNMIEQNDRDARQRAADARQREEDERKRREEAGQDRLAGIMWGARDPVSNPTPLAENPTDYPVYTPFDANLEGPPTDERVVAATQPRIDELRRAQAAEEQGRAPQGSFRVVLERNISALMAEMPDQQAEIMHTLRESGFSHYLFREAEADQEFHEANVAQAISMRNAYANVAVENGLVAPGEDPNVAATIGRTHAEEASRTKRLRELQEAARAGNAEARAQLEWEQRQASENARRNFTANLSAIIQPRWAQLTNLLTQGNGSAEAMSLLPDALRNMDVIVENHITAARQAGADEATITSMRADWNNMKESAIGFVTGPESDVGVAKQALEGIQTRMGLSIAEALPTYMALQGVFGATALAEMLGTGPGSLPTEVVEAARREMRGIQGAIDTNQERVSLATTAQILRGELNISELTEQEARQTMPQLVTTIRGQAPSVATGGGNARSLVNGNLAVANAAMELQPGNSSVQSEIIAVNALFSNDQIRALGRIRTDDPAMGDLAVRSQRAAAQHLWSNLRTHQLTSAESGNGLWGLVRVNERYQPRLSRTAYEQWAATQRGTGYGRMQGGEQGTVRDVPSYEEMATRPPAALRSLVGAQNQVIDFLVQTTQYDDDFRGVDNTSARAFYMHNIVPEAMRRRQETEGRRSATFQEQSQEFRRGLDSDRSASEQLRTNAVTNRIANEDFQSAPPRDEVQRTVRDLAQSVGVPWDVVNRLVTKESQWDINADSGSSQGLFQLNDGPTTVQRTWQENAQEGLRRWVTAGEGAERVLGRAPNPGEQYVMYQQGPGGGKALLDPANADQLAVDVLRPLYGDLATARQAITGNGGNLNMTARQFAQHIQNYFNRR